MEERDDRVEMYDESSSSSSSVNGRSNELLSTLSPPLRSLLLVVVVDVAAAPGVLLTLLSAEEEEEEAGGNPLAHNGHSVNITFHSPVRRCFRFNCITGWWGHFPSEFIIDDDAIISSVILFVFCLFCLYNVLCYYFIHAWLVAAFKLACHFFVILFFHTK